MLKNRSEYKQQAAKLMVGNYLNVFLIMLVFSVVGGAIVGLFTNKDNQSLSAISTLIDFVLTAAMSYGFVRMIRLIIDGKKPEIADILLCGYKENYVRTLVVYLLQSLFTFLFMLLLIIPGIVKSYAYSFTMYLLHIDPEIKQMDVLRKSEKLMYGHKTDLFMLDLSYIGWYFLSMFTLGILLIWVVPKHMTARMLYLDEIYEASLPKAPVEEPVIQ